MVEKNNKTSMPVSASTPFDGVHRIETTFLGMKYTEDLSKNEAEKKEQMEALKKDYTLTVDFDFTGFTVEEAADMLSSTTSAMKMLQNNELKHWTEEEALKHCFQSKTEPYPCSLRYMLDNRQTRSISDEEKARRSIKKMMDQGKTKEQILALIAEM